MLWNLNQYRNLVKASIFHPLKPTNRHATILRTVCWTEQNPSEPTRHSTLKLSMWKRRMKVTYMYKSERKRHFSAESKVSFKTKTQFFRTWLWLVRGLRNRKGRKNFVLSSIPTFGSLHGQRKIFRSSNCLTEQPMHPTSCLTWKHCNDEREKW